MRSVLTRVIVAALAVSVVGAPTSPASSVEAAVLVEDDRFTPREVSIAVGDTVSWSRAPGSTGPHNVREDERLFRSGPVTEGPFSYEVAFSSGTFHYFCEAHGSRAGGMDGAVRVPPTIDESPPGGKVAVTWAVPGTGTGSRFDVQFRRGGGRWQEWKEATRGDGAIFGKRGEPERARPGARYRFRVRSVDKRAASRWSPVVST